MQTCTLSCIATNMTIVGNIAILLAIAAMLPLRVWLQADTRLLTQGDRRYVVYIMQAHQ